MSRKPPQLTGNDGKPFVLTINDFSGGVMTLFDETRLPQNSVFQASNMMLDQDGVWTLRPGTANYGATLTTPIDGGGSFTKYNVDGTTSTYVWVIDNGSFKTSQDGGSWTTVSGKTWTTGYPVVGKQQNSRIYLANGKDALAYYDIALGTLVTFSSILAPTGVSATRAVLTAGSFNVYYKVTAINSVGETIASAEATTTVNKTRDNWDSTTSEKVTVAWSASTGATRYNIYYSDQTGTEVYLDSVTALTYDDTGIAVPNPYQEAPLADTTGGPAYGDLALSNNRMFLTKDPTKPYRVAWTGTGQYAGSLNPFYGGGYIDLELGGNERPEKVTHFRDGKGTSLATVLTSDPNGSGSTWHIALSTLTVDNQTIVIPEAYKQQGSVGTRSPLGVIEYDNSVYFPSPKGFQSLGSQQSILNVLVTNDISGNIRPTVDGITNSAASQVCGYAWKGRLLWSVPVGSSSNNQTLCLDLERKGKWALPWSLGVKKFFEYTDSSGIIRLLAIPVSGAKLIEFNENFTDDLGSVISTDLESGLIHWDKDHSTWAAVDKVYIELADPRGSVTFSVSGTQKTKPFSSLGSITIGDTVSGADFSSDLFSDFLFSDSNSAPTTFTQASVKKLINLRGKQLNNIKWQLATNSVNSKYALMQIVIKGSILPTSDPSSYKA